MLQKLRTRLAASEALPQLSFLAVIIGILTGFVVLCLHLLVEWGQKQFLTTADDFESLPPLFRVLLPVVGGLVVGLLIQSFRPENRGVGVVHVMERLVYHQGYLPLRNAVLQFFGAAICLVSGHSVGREGPVVHLGGATGSLLGQTLKLPNNSLRILIACGVSAAISASFNTPLAAVIFTMEVVMVEYSVASFTPVIISTVIATVITRHFTEIDATFRLSSDMVFQQPFPELAYLVLVGIVIGLVATLFIYILEMVTKNVAPKFEIWQRTTLAGLLTGIVSLWVPQIMGTGYDTVNATLMGESVLSVLLMIAIAKLLITPVCLGLGLPGGLIGPILLIGAMVGGAMGMLISEFMPHAKTEHMLYAMFGMGAMMGAVLQAPLAALTALLEFTYNPSLILPSMVVIISAHLIVGSSPWRKHSVFIELMRARGLDYRTDPISQSLRRIGVTHAMEQQFVVLPCDMQKTTAIEALQHEPLWIVAHDQQQNCHLLPASDLARYLQSNETEESINLVSIPAQRQQIIPIYPQATLQEAQELLDKQGCEALYITDKDSKSSGDPSVNIQGILTRHDIETHYRYSSY
ncbi:chloride channel protein [Candidatus Albibeggiatoa sp. nov. NOAA]|uniref:chloride channel protein n=1 Tax=Candidatus Albibeggiatoa sp. nov. NOAA TaxID=3162724 RepID=UPI0032FCFA40|nr:chloride channel protein [Thiotrichaceae bacterium]